MPTFAYTARDLTGKQITGTLEANGEREVTAILSEQSLFPVNVKDVGGVKQSQSDLNGFMSKFVNKDLSLNDAKGYHKSLFTAMNADKIAIKMITIITLLISSTSPDALSAASYSFPLSTDHNISYALPLHYGCNARSA